MIPPRAILAVVVALGMAPALPGQGRSEFEAWNQPVAPFRIVGNLYYVGTNEITAFLLTSPEGHILLDGGFPETAPLIADAIRTLGFGIEDVRILLNSHAHFDHAGGLAALRAMSGARVLASAPDAELLERGGAGDYLLGDSATFPPVPVDRRLHDGERVGVGGVTLTAHLTPGHTRGCTTWTTTITDGGRKYNVVFVCSVTVLPGARLAGPSPSYPGIADDYARTFRVLDSLTPDVFLAAHGSFFHLERKRRARAAGGEDNPFVDPDGYHAYVDRGRRRYLDRLTADADAAQSAPPSMLIGTFLDDYGIRHSVSDTVWVQHPDTRYHVVRWDTAGRYLIARNDLGNPADGGKWTRIDWTTFAEMAPYEWGFCLSAFDAPTREAAESTAVARRATPRTGCNGYPFSRMRPTRSESSDPP